MRLVPARSWTIREPFVDTDDIADVAVASLTEDGHVGQLYELTGPRLLTFAQAVEEISRASGRQLRFETVSMERSLERSLNKDSQPKSSIS